MSTTTLRTWLDSTSDTITDVFFPQTLEDDYGLSRWAKLPHGHFKRSDLPESLLNEPFDTGYGSQDVPSFYAWSRTQVYYVHEYNGSVSFASVPRSPSAIR